NGAPPPRPARPPPPPPGGPPPPGATPPPTPAPPPPVARLHLLEEQRIPRPLPEARNLRRDHRGSIPYGRNGDGRASLERKATRPSRAAARARRPCSRAGPGQGG